MCSVTCSDKSEDDELLKAPVVGSLPKAAEEMNGCHKEAQDLGSSSACTQGDGDPHNLEVKNQDSCLSEESKKTDQQPIRSPEQAVEVKKKITYAMLLKEGRRFNIDLMSKVSVHLINAILHIFIKFQMSSIGFSSHFNSRFDLNVL